MEEKILFGETLFVKSSSQQGTCSMLAAEAQEQDVKAVQN